MSWSYIRRKMLYMSVRMPGRNIRVNALKKLGFDIGKDVYIGPGLSLAVGIADKNIKLLLGDRVSIGPNVNLILASHPNNSKLNKIVTSHPRIIAIGADSWLGANCTILPGITIGECCIIGAGAVVTKDIPSYAVVAGVPAKIIKYIDKSLLENDEHTS